MEIERKWLINKFPDDENLQCIKSAIMHQGYISTAPAVRIRSTDENGNKTFKLCFKGKGTLVRQEFEIDIDQQQFNELCKFVNGELVSKNFKVYKLNGGFNLEVSLVDEGKPGAFYYAEVEFETEQQANSFCPPAFLGEEKTNDENFSMSEYFKKTRNCNVK